MRSLNKPVIDGNKLFAKLYSHVQNRPVKEEVLRNAIAAAETEYATQCTRGNYDYASNVNVPIGVDSSFMTKLYETHLRDGVGRSEYLAILRASDLKKLCAYCQIREAESCDHYKEKSDFPLLAISPSNLLPACTRCNGRLGVKGERFHCYYESVDSFEWLGVDLILTSGSPVPSLNYYVRQDFCEDKSLMRRLTNTFNSIGLSQRWSVELGVIMYRISEEFAAKSKRSSREAFMRDFIHTNSYPWNGPHAMLYDEILRSDWIDSAIQLRI